MLQSAAIIYNVLAVDIHVYGCGVWGIVVCVWLKKTKDVGTAICKRIVAFFLVWLLHVYPSLHACSCFL